MPLTDMRGEPVNTKTFRVADRKRIVKRPSYRHGVDWIALNDGPASDDALNRDVVAGYVSTLLLADLFGCDPNLVAADIISRRLIHAISAEGSEGR